MSAENNPYQGLIYFATEKPVAYFDTQQASRKNLEFWLKALGGSDSEFFIRYGIDDEVITFSSQDLITDDPEKDEKVITKVCKEIFHADHLEFEKVVANPQSAIPYQEHYVLDDSNTTSSPDGRQTPNEER